MINLVVKQFRSQKNSFIYLFIFKSIKNDIFENQGSFYLNKEFLRINFFIKNREKPIHVQNIQKYFLKGFKMYSSEFKFNKKKVLR